MRLDRQAATDHDVLTGVDPADHHPPVEAFSFAINSQAIAGLSAYEWRSSVMEAGHKVVRAILRGTTNVSSTQGHDGLFLVASDVVQECSSIGLKPYGPGSGYYTSYMGGYSRLHGDSYLSPSMFGPTFSSPTIRLRDAYFDTATNQVVLEFYNTNVVSKNLTVYGNGLVK